MATPYSALYASVLSKISDYEFLKYEPDELNEALHDYLRPAIVRFPFCKQNLTNRDDSNGTFNIELTDTEIEILSDLMVIEWIKTTFIRTATALKQSLPSKDFHQWSQANHIKEVRELYKSLMEEVGRIKTLYTHVGNRDNIMLAMRTRLNAARRW